MPELYENFHIFHFQNRIVSTEAIRGNPEFKNDVTLRLKFRNPTDIKDRISPFVSHCIIFHKTLMISFTALQLFRKTSQFLGVLWDRIGSLPNLFLLHTDLL